MNLQAEVVFKPILACQELCVVKLLPDILDMSVAKLLPNVPDWSGEFFASRDKLLALWFDLGFCMLETCLRYNRILGAG